MKKMKKLGKLTINPEKVIKNDELISLRGGYECPDHLYYCICYPPEEYKHEQICSISDFPYWWLDVNCWHDPWPGVVTPTWTGGTCTLI
jgi:hypothetical protein